MEYRNSDDQLEQTTLKQENGHNKIRGVIKGEDER